MVTSTLLSTIEEMRNRAQRLEQEAAALRLELDQVATALSDETSVVARYVVDGEEYAITEADIARVRARLLKPRPPETLRELALADKIAGHVKMLPPEDQYRRFKENVEAIRAEAITDGTAIDDEREAAIGD
jgi:hypothetical protein